MSKLSSFFTTRSYIYSPLFRWLRDRMGSVSPEMHVIMRMMDFILTDNNVEISKLRYALQKQVRVCDLVHIVNSQTVMNMLQEDSSSLKLHH